MKKVTEAKVVTAKGAELKVFVDHGYVKVETPAGIMRVESIYSPRGNVKVMTYSLDGKRRASELASGAAMVNAVLNCYAKEGRDLYIEESVGEFQGAEFGDTFMITESADEYYTAAYKYN